MKSLIIGLVGLPGSGKTTTAKILAKQGFKNIILSSFIKEELIKKGLKINRKNLQDIGDELRGKYGSSILARRALKIIKEEKISKAVIDGIRNLGEIKYLKRQPNFYLLGLSAAPDLRFKRLKQNKDKHNGLKTWDDFVRFELREDRGMGTRSGQQNKICYLQAKYFINNDEGLRDLERKIAKFLRTT